MSEMKSIDQLSDETKNSCPWCRAKVSTEGCHTSYVWLGNTSKEKDKLGEGANPNNNVITIKQPSNKVVDKI